MRKNIQREPAHAKVKKPSPPARMLFHEILDRILENIPRGLDNQAAEIEAFLELIGNNPALKNEVSALRSIAAAGWMLVELETESHADFEGEMTAK